MSKVFIPAGYHSCLSLYDTQKAISLIKRVFEDTLCGNLNLSRVSAPLFVEASTGKTGKGPAVVTAVCGGFHRLE